MTHPPGLPLSLPNRFMRAVGQWGRVERDKRSRQDEVRGCKHFAEDLPTGRVHDALGEVSEVGRLSKDTFWALVRGGEWNENFENNDLERNARREEMIACP